MISEKMSVKFAEYIKFLGSHYDRQTIMVTHNDSLANTGDLTYYVSKNNLGVSSVLDNSLISGIDIDDVFNEIELEKLKETTDVHESL